MEETKENQNREPPTQAHKSSVENSNGNLKIMEVTRIREKPIPSNSVLGDEKTFIPFQIESTTTS